MCQLRMLTGDPDLDLRDQGGVGKDEVGGEKEAEADFGALDGGSMQDPRPDPNGCRVGWMGYHTCSSGECPEVSLPWL